MVPPRSASTSHDRVRPREVQHFVAAEQQGTIKLQASLNFSKASSNSTTKKERSSAKSAIPPKVDMRVSSPGKVAVVDDHPLFRQGLCVALRSEPDFEVVGEAGSAQ